MKPTEEATASFDPSYEQPWPVELSLPYRPPLDWSGLLRFLSMRATAGVERVSGERYCRTVALGGVTGALEVSRSGRGDSLILRVTTAAEPSASELSRRVGAIFDLSADPRRVSGHFGRDPVLAAAAAYFPGVRVPGSWDGFETAVRAILGQRISVKAATSLAGRLVARCGEAIARPPAPRLTHLFPTPLRLAAADLTGLGLTRQKERSIQALSGAVANGSLRLDGTVASDETVAALLELPGIGAWTAGYVAMRALGDRDAFPAGDLVLRKAASPRADAALSEAQLAALAESWRPWRSYAAMLLWASHSLPRPASLPVGVPGATS